ncbi:hypothetical protein GCM10027037_04850 [Mucilaginibacter koreensis]
MIDLKVQLAIENSLNEFSKYNSINAQQFGSQVISVFTSDDDFLDKVEDLDDLFDDYPQAEALREVYFDLLMVNFFSADMKRLDEDYLDSKEWAEIEEDTIDRGTELLNMLLYLNECKDESIEPSLEDYLSEFLLVDDDEFQDEHRIYEPVIANQILVESTPEEVNRVADTLSDDEELQELFYPLMCFFQNTHATEADLKEVAEASDNKDFDTAVYSILTTFNK